MPGALAIWLYGHQVAIVEKQRSNRLRLSYTESALDAYEGGTPLLSLALPLTRDRYANGVTRAFLDGLLPEGEPRRVIAEDLDLPASDSFGLPAAVSGAAEAVDGLPRSLVDLVDERVMKLRAVAASL